jgi:hypothetical protein
VDATDGVASKDTGTGLTYALTGDPVHGSAVVNADGSYTYTPDVGYSGPDSFTYTVTDADHQTASGIVTIDVVPPASPVVIQVLPPDGPTVGGTSIEVIGTGFTGATEVAFGSTDLVPASAPHAAVTGNDAGTTSLTFTLVSSTLITLDDPAGTGVVDVRVTTPVATSAVTAADRFTYDASATTPPTSTTTAPPTSTSTSTIAAGAFGGAASTSPPTGSGSGPSSGSSSGSGGLAFTGLDVALLLVGGLASVGVGAFLVIATRRNRKQRQARTSP